MLIYIYQTICSVSNYCPRYCYWFPSAVLISKLRNYDNFKRDWYAFKIPFASCYDKQLKQINVCSANTIQIPIYILFFTTVIVGRLYLFFRIWIFYIHDFICGKNIFMFLYFAWCLHVLRNVNLSFTSLLRDKHFQATFLCDSLLLAYDTHQNPTAINNCLSVFYDVLIKQAVKLQMPSKTWRCPGSLSFRYL